MPAPSIVDAYLETLSEPARSTLAQVAAVIRANLPQGSTEILAYNIPTFHCNGAHIAGLAAFKKHLTLFPMNGSTTAALAADLQDYKTSKGAIQFPIDKPLPAALIKKILKSSIATNTKKR
jgi:uncharacterized protein YdhG (YjbR/CyaY superfamily)